MNPAWLAGYHERMATLAQERQGWWAREAAEGYPRVLCENVHKGNIKKIRQILRWKASNVNCSMPDGWTPLMAAADNGRPDICRMLLQYRADPSIVSNDAGDDKWATTALGVAALMGHVRCIKELLDGGADPAQHYHEGEGALYEALCTGEAEACRLLLAAGAKPTALSFSCCQEGGRAPEGLGSSFDMVIEARGDINATKHGGTGLMFACARGNASVVKLLLERGADTRILHAMHGDVLSIAIVAKATACVEALLEHGVSATVAEDDPYGRPPRPMSVAYFRGGLAEVQLLRTYGADFKPLLEPQDAEKQAKAKWLASVQDYATPLHFVDHLSQARAIRLLRSGDHSLFARKSMDAPTALQIAENSPHAGDPTSAAFVCVQAAQWSPQSHHLFPAMARKRVALLLLLGQHLATKHGLFTELWFTVMRFCVEAVEPAFRCADNAARDKLACDGARELTAPLAALLALVSGPPSRVVYRPVNLTVSTITTAMQALHSAHEFEAVSTQVRYTHHEKYGRVRLDDNMWTSEAGSFLCGDSIETRSGAVHTRGQDLMRLSREQQGTTPAEGRVRIICIGTAEFSDAGSRLVAVWDAPRLHTGPHLLVVMQIVHPSHSESLVYALPALSRRTVFLPTPPGLLNLHRCISRLSIFDNDGGLIYHHANVMEHSDGEIYGDHAWWMGDHDGPPSLTIRPFDGVDCSAGVLLDF
jgi:hypothetical protein